MLHIEPKESLLDELVSIRITGLRPGQPVTMRCETVEQKFVFESHAHFIASLNGEVDLSQDPSFGGCYLGVDAMGIFAHMLPASGQMMGLRYFPRHCMDAMVFKLQVYDGHLSESSKLCHKLKEGGGAVHVPLMEDVALRRCNGSGVTRHEVRHGRVRGTIFRPPGAGPFKGVIDIYGGAGGINESRVAMLASHGFIAFTLPHHKYADLPELLMDVEIEYFMEAIDYFTSLPDVQSNIGVLGVCAGGAIALFLSTISSKISALIAFASPYTFLQPLLYKGSQTEYLNSLEETLVFDKRGGFYFDELINHHTPSDDFAIRIEKSTCKFLIVAGSDDKSVCAVRSGRYLLERMRRHGKGGQITLLEYPGAGHFIDPPYMPKTLLMYYPEFKACAAVGGEAAESSIASLHCWRETLEFLKRNVGMHSRM